jgi:hypothetical protein
LSRRIVPMAEYFSQYCATTFVVLDGKNISRQACRVDLVLMVHSSRGLPRALVALRGVDDITTNLSSTFFCRVADALDWGFRNRNYLRFRKGNPSPQVIHHSQIFRIHMLTSELPGLCAPFRLVYKVTIA